MAAGLPATTAARSSASLAAPARFSGTTAVEAEGSARSVAGAAASRNSGTKLQCDGHWCAAHRAASEDYYKRSVRLADADARLAAKPDVDAASLEARTGAGADVDARG